MVLILLVIALVCFLLFTFHVVLGTISLLGLGLCFWVVATIAANHWPGRPVP